MEDEDVPALFRTHRQTRESKTEMSVKSSELRNYRFSGVVITRPHRWGHEFHHQLPRRGEQHILHLRRGRPPSADEAVHPADGARPGHVLPAPSLRQRDFRAALQLLLLRRPRSPGKLRRHGLRDHRPQRLLRKELGVLHERSLPHHRGDRNPRDLPICRFRSASGRPRESLQKERDKHHALPSDDVHVSLLPVLHDPASLSSRPPFLRFFLAI